MIHKRLSAEQAANSCAPFRREGNSYRATCPCCGGNDLVLTDGEQSLLAYCWHLCESRDVLRALNGGIDRGAPGSPRRRPVNTTVKEGNRSLSDVIRRIWSESQPLTSDDLASRYLKSREIRGIPRVDALRFHPSLTTPKDVRQIGGSATAPAMVARFDNASGEMIAIHRTWLQSDGKGKAEFDNPKRVLGNGLKGGAIRLFETGKRLGIAEGIETAIACCVAAGIPTWACYSASIMPAVAIPRTVREVIVFADHDPAGIKAAEALADRLVEEGFQVKLLLPGTPGNDWLDEILKEAGSVEA